MAGKKLYRIGELAKLTELSPRTIDYYTKLGLIEPESRSHSNYRYYSDETVVRLKRIESLKRDKYTLEEIRESLDRWQQVSPDEQVAVKLTALQQHLQSLEREVREIEPLVGLLKPKQSKALIRNLTAQSAACIEALLVLLSKGPLM